jgi:hypothetical protein
VVVVGHDPEGVGGARLQALETILWISLVRNLRTKLNKS